MKALQFAGQTAIVTGGATGIGRSIAITLATRGANVVIASRTQERAIEVVEQISGKGGSATFVKTDVTESNSIDHLIDSVIADFGSLEILVNNSGIETQEDWFGPSDEDWDRMFATNTRGTWLCCKSALPHLLVSQGVIVNVASMAGLTGVAGSVGYAASKAAVVSLTKSLALAYADQGVRVNAICPGPVETQMTYDEWDLVGGSDEGRRRALAVSPARRITSPDEVAELAAYLASGQSLSITGAAIPIDGGKTSGLMLSERYRW